MEKWGSVIGLGFDLLGAILVFCGVWTNIKAALQLEQTAPLKMFDDLGSPENLAADRFQTEARARERVRTSRWALWGLASLGFGFALQAFSAWPR